MWPHTPSHCTPDTSADWKPGVDGPCPQPPRPPTHPTPLALPTPTPPPTPQALQQKLLLQLVAELRRLGAQVVAADSGSLILATGKRNLTAAVG